jgi:midasin (ATPase involved in ribosome maturation)
VNVKSANLVKKKDGSTDVELIGYLEDFPFPYYCVIQQISHLPLTLSHILINWFSFISQ